MRAERRRLPGGQLVPHLSGPELLGLLPGRRRRRRLRLLVGGGRGHRRHRRRCRGMAVGDRSGAELPIVRLDLSPPAATDPDDQHDHGTARTGRGQRQRSRQRSGPDRRRSAGRARRPRTPRRAPRPRSSVPRPLWWGRGVPTRMAGRPRPPTATPPRWTASEPPPARHSRRARAARQHPDLAGLRGPAGWLRPRRLAHPTCPEPLELSRRFRLLILGPSPAQRGQNGNIVT